MKLASPAERSILFYFCDAMEGCKDNHEKRRDLISLSDLQLNRSPDFIKAVHTFDNVKNEDVLATSKKLREDLQ